MTDQLLMQQPGISEIKWNFASAFIGGIGTGDGKNALACQWKVASIVV